MQQLRWDFIVSQLYLHACKNVELPERNATRVFRRTQYKRTSLSKFFNISTTRESKKKFFKFFHFTIFLNWWRRRGVERFEKEMAERSEGWFLANVQGNPVENGIAENRRTLFLTSRRRGDLGWDVRSACWTPVPLSFSFRVRVALRRAVDRTSRLRHRSIERDREIELETKCFTWNTI